MGVIPTKHPYSKVTSSSLEYLSGFAALLDSHEHNGNVTDSLNIK